MAIEPDEIGTSGQVAHHRRRIIMAVCMLPSVMGVPKPSGQSKLAASPDIGRMRITVMVAMPVVQAMVCDPVEWTILPCHAPEDHQDPFDRTTRGECAMRE